MRSLALLLLAGCGADESRPTEFLAVTESVEESPQVETSLGSRVVPELAEFLNRAVWFDDVFGHTVDSDVKVEVKECTAARLVVEVSGLREGKYPHPAGVAVRLEFDQSDEGVSCSASARWWTDMIGVDSSGKESPRTGESAVNAGRIVIAKTGDGFAVRFMLDAVWITATHPVSGGFTVPATRVGPFLDAWNAARAAEKR